MEALIQLHSPLLIIRVVSNLCLLEKTALSSSARLVALEINLEFQIPSWESFSTGKLFLTCQILSNSTLRLGEVAFKLKFGDLPQEIV